MLFRKWGCLVGSENSIFRKLKSVDPKKKPLTTEIILHFYFPFKVFLENFTQRERARARESLHNPTIAISPTNIPVAVDRDLAIARSCRWSRSRLREIAPDRDRDRRRDLTKRRSRDLVCRRERKIRDRDRRFARSRRRSRSREEGEITIAPSIAISPSQDRAVDRNRRRGHRTGFVVVDDFFSGLWLVFFWICVFLLLFQTPENIFRKFFWNATKHHGNIFLFRKLAFPENMYFPENVLQQPNTALSLYRHPTNRNSWRG